VEHDGAWASVAGVPLNFVIACRDSAGNSKLKGGDAVLVADASVKDLGSGRYDVSWTHTAVGLRKLEVKVNGEAMENTPHIDVTPADVHLPLCGVSLTTAGGEALDTPGAGGGGTSPDWTVVAGTHTSLKVCRAPRRGGTPRTSGPFRLSDSARCEEFREA
jgi:hypothetical protein